jgi:methyltransferase (TIGR00027 family)
VVLLGAGYDDRAFRLASPGVRYVEVDHPRTQADKRRRLERLGVDTTGVDFVAVDLEVDDLSGALAGVLDPMLATLVVCEAVLPYLDRPSAERTLWQVAHVDGVSVTLLADLPVAPESWRSRIALGVLRAGTAAVGEPIRLVIPRSEIATVLGGAGWDIRSLVSGRELSMPAAASDTVFVEAVAKR